jgi:hypothetical protein
MQSYRPRPRKNQPQVVRQMLHDLQQRLQSNIGQLAAAARQGSPEQLSLAHQQVRSLFFKTAPEMKETAYKLGGIYFTPVQNYLASVEVLTQSDPRSLSPSLIERCYDAARILERQLVAA